jgi:hypothetical protein
VIYLKELRIIIIFRGCVWFGIIQRKQYIIKETYNAVKKLPLWPKIKNRNMTTGSLDLSPQAAQATVGVVTMTLHFHISITCGKISPSFIDGQRHKCCRPASRDTGRDGKRIRSVVPYYCEMGQVRRYFAFNTRVCM